MSQIENLTEILLRANRNEPGSREYLFRLVEGQLREIADGYMRRERAGHTLQATALIDDAWMQLLGHGKNLDWESRTHFYRAAARAMRHILVDHERGKGAAKRPPRDRRQPLDGEQAALTGPSLLDVLALHEALEKLAQFDPRQAEVVELHHFGGYTLDETAKLVGVSLSTVKAEWTVARAWLHRELTRGDYST